MQNEIYISFFDTVELVELVLSIEKLVFEIVELVQELIDIVELKKWNPVYEIYSKEQMI